MKKPEGEGGPSAWLPYIAVEDVDGTVARVEGLGGKVFMPPTDIPDVGRFSVLADPTGATIALLQALPMESKEG
jgi:predicted enzyme related to lactoylglutathione lyase